MSRRAVVRRVRRPEPSAWRPPTAQGRAGPAAADPDVATLQDPPAPLEAPSDRRPDTPAAVPTDAPTDQAREPDADPNALPQDTGPTPAQQKPPAPKPNRVTLSPAGTVPVPPQGTLKPKAAADVAGMSWSLHDGSAKVDPGTTIAADGTITVGAAQAAGTVQVRATNADGAFAFATLRFTGVPTDITSTSLIQEASAGNYGHVFDHVFTSSTGKVTDLEGVALGERFPKLDNPDGASHVIKPPDFPFGGSFTLHTATLTAGATNNWFLTAAGELGGSHDSVTIGRAGIDVRPFLRNASNPQPARSLPVGFAIEQHFHWYNPLESDPAARWTDFKQVDHERTLQSDGSGGLVFETKSNKLGDGGDTYSGPPAVSALAATPATTPHSTAAEKGKPAPAARTVALVATTLPGILAKGQRIAWTLLGPPLGCSVQRDPQDPLAAILKIGTEPGTVTVRAALGTSFDDVKVTVT